MKGFNGSRFLAPLVLFLACPLAQAAPCPEPDFNRIFAEVRRAVTVQEAIAVRAAHLTEMCTLEHFARLTDLEASEAGTHPFPEYRQALGEFAAERIGGFLRGRRYPEIRALVASGLLPKMRSFDDSIRIRQALLETVAKCDEFLDLMEVREDYTARAWIEREIRHRFWHDLRVFCGR